MSEWKAQTSLSFALLCVRLCYPDRRFQHQFFFDNQRGSILPQLRQNLVDKALKEGASHLLFIDSDMTFPDMLANEWMAEDRPVIAANCSTKSMPAYPTARAKGGKTGVPAYSDVTAQRFGEIWRVGTGVMMIRRDVLEALPRPAFTPYWHTELDRYVFEDWVMVEHIERAGFPIVIDHEMSLHIGHIGDYEFTHNHIAMSRRAEAAAEFNDKRKVANG